MKKTLKKLPEFKTEQDEVSFWEKHDVTDYFDLSKAPPAVFPNLKPSTETISIRLPKSLLQDIKNQANKNDVPYQSFMKIMLTERLKELLGGKLNVTSRSGLHPKHARA
ncbi:MAG: BrnA antitoxin family protein [Fibrobacterota bacterium]